MSNWTCLPFLARKHYVNSLVVIFAFFGALFFSEIILRWSGFVEKKFDELATSVNSFVQYSGDRDLGYTLKSNYRGSPKSRNNVAKPVFYSINSLGFRGDEPEKSSQPGKDIFIVGDSISFGLGVGEGEQYPSLLRKRLNDDRQPQRLNVHNCSVPGYNIEQQFTFCSSSITKLAPAIVILQAFYNDLFGSHRYALGNLWNGFAQRHNSHLLFLVNWQRDNTVKPLPPIGYDRYLQTLRRFKTLSESIGARLVLILPPPADRKKMGITSWPELQFLSESQISELDANKGLGIGVAALHNLLYTATKEAGIEYWPLYEEIKKNGNNIDRFRLRYDDDHFNYLGHQFIAEFIFQRTRSALDRDD